jgi:hypothetical protein
VTVVRHEARRRWLVVAALVAALCAIPVVIAALPVARSSLNVQELRTRILASARAPYQGLVETRGSLGLPDLPGLSDVTDLLGSTTRMRVWYDSSRRWRVDMITETGERDFYQTREGMSIWDYERNLLTRVLGEPPVRLPQGSDLTPPELARRLLRVATPRDRVSELSARRVAGVAAAGLRITPGDAATTVGHVDIWADPATGLPVELRMTAKGSDLDVLSARFLDLRQRRPAGSVLAVAPAVLTPSIRLSAPDLVSRLAGFALYPLPERLAGRPALPLPYGHRTVRAYGGGFSSFAVLPLPGRFGRRVMRATQDAGAAEVQLKSAQAQGLVIRTPLLTALIVTDFLRDRTVVLAGPARENLLVTAANELLSERP